MLCVSRGERPEKEDDGSVSNEVCALIVMLYHGSRLLRISNKNLLGADM